MSPPSDRWRPRPSDDACRRVPSFGDGRRRGLVLHGSRDFHVRRTARERYGVDDTLLGIRGDLAVADLAAIRVSRSG